MSRLQITVRAAVPSDAPVLADLWGQAARRADSAVVTADLRAVIDRVSAVSEEEIVVAECDGALAGAVYLMATTVTPVNLEPVVLAISPQVFAGHRRRGVGRCLIEAAVDFAEVRGIGHVVSAAVSGDRDSNRFLARLGLGPQAVLRAAPTAAVRARVTPRQPAGNRSIRQVLAVRRSMRSREQGVG